MALGTRYLGTRLSHLLNQANVLISKQNELCVQVAELAELTQLLPPCSPTVRNPAPDSSLKSCFSPIASTSAAACRLRPLQLLLAAFMISCCSRSRPLRLLLPDCTLDSSPCPAPGPNVLEHSSRVRGSVNKLKYEGRASL